MNDKMASLTAFLNDKDVMDAYRTLVERKASLLAMSIALGEKARDRGVYLQVVPPRVDNGIVVRPQYLEARPAVGAPCDFVEQMNARLEAG